MTNGCMLPCQVSISFSFLPFYLSQVDSMFSFCFHELPGLLWGLKVCLIADFSISCVIIFHQKNQGLNQNLLFFAIILCYCVEDQSRAYVVDCGMKTCILLVKKSKFEWICLCFLLDLTHSLSFKELTSFYGFFIDLLVHLVIKQFSGIEKQVLCFH